MKVNDEHSIFYEKYKPQLVQDLVLPQEIKTKLQKFVDKESLPNIGLFSANPGTGKSSTANAIIRELDCEALWINGSLENGIDVLRGKISAFASTVSFDDKIKIVVIDEFDYFSTAGMAAFRGFLDEFSESCRFIFTGNHPERIIEPLLDRMEVYDFNNFNKKEMIKPIFDRLVLILENEGITYDPKNLVPVINTYYPSIRSMVGALQKFSDSGEFKVSESELDGLDVFDKIMVSVKAKNFQEVVTKVNDLNAPDNMYGFIYKKINDYYPAQAQPQVVLIVAKYQHRASTVRDKNLNLSACLAELMR